LKKEILTVLVVEINSSEQKGYVGKLDGSAMGGPAKDMFYSKGSYCSNNCSAESYR